MGFRYFVLREAQRLGLTGWVHNRTDGSVGLWVQGGAAEIAEFKECLAVGPRHASISSLQIEEAQPNPSVQGFEVR